MTIQKQVHISSLLCVLYVLVKQISTHCQVLEANGSYEFVANSVHSAIFEQPSGGTSFGKPHIFELQVITYTQSRLPCHAVEALRCFGQQVTFPSSSLPE